MERDAAKGTPIPATVALQFAIGPDIGSADAILGSAA
jgi:hypothetical protein